MRHWLALILFKSAVAQAAWPSLERTVHATFNTEFTPAREERARAYSRLHGLPHHTLADVSTWNEFHPDIRFQLARQESYDDLITARVREMGSPATKLEGRAFREEMALLGEMLARTIERIVESERPDATRERVVDAVKIITHAQSLAAQAPSAAERDAFWINARRAIRELRRGEMMTEYDENTFRTDAEPDDSDDPRVTARRVFKKLVEWSGSPELVADCQTALGATIP